MNLLRIGLPALLLASVVSLTATANLEAQVAVDSTAADPTDTEGAPQAIEAPPAKALRFNFQRQPWQEVLQWLADQADLSLVLDAPPPGSFNYTDAKTYTADEAINLVNGVLASKGYTLLRREQMMMLVNLQDKIPRTLVPRVPLAEVALRGTHEFVTVAFPLEGRSAELALAEIQPLISQFGSASAMPASGQLLVTDQAGLMEAIAAVIRSIPKPEPVPEPRIDNEIAEFRVYPLEGADAKAAIEMLKAIVSGKFVHDPAGDLINAYATPSQHKIIEQLMGQVRGADDLQRYRLELFPLEGLTAARQAQLLADLRVAVGTGQLRLDVDNEQLVIWATPQQQHEVRKALVTLLATGDANSTATAEVYVFDHADAQSLMPLLQAAVPQARLSPGGSSDRILAIARPEQHQLLAQLVTQLDQRNLRDRPTLKEYRLAQDPPAELATILAQAAPRGKIRIDKERQAVIVSGTEQDQQIVAELLADVRENLAPRPDRPLEIYVLDKLQQERFADVRPSLEEAAPAARLVWNQSSGELFVWASPAEQEVISNLIQSLADQPRRKPTQQFRSYPAPVREIDALAAMVARVAPRAVTSVDRRTGRLLVWAEAEDHEQLAPIFEPAPGAATDSSEPVSYRSYRAGQIDLALAARLLGERFPAAQFETDARAQSIVAQATEAEHQQIDELVGQLRAGSAIQNTHEVQVYPLGNITVQQAQGLQRIFPTMRINVDAVAQQVAAWGTGEDQRQLADALESLGGNRAAGGWKVEVFALQRAKATEMAPGLQLLFPGLSAVAINESQLLVRCQPDLQQEVAELISRLDISRGVNQRQQARAFPLKHAEPLGLLTTLRTTFPVTTGTAFSYDPQTEALMAVADQSQMDLIEQMVTTADRRGDGEQGARVLRVHPLTGVEGPAALAALEKLFKERGANPLLSIDATRNRLVAVADPGEQNVVEEVLAALRPKETQLEVFSLDTMEPLAAEIAISQLFSQQSTSDGTSVEVEADDDGGRILVRATPEQLTEIRALLVKMGEVHLLTSESDLGGARLVPWDSDNPVAAIEQFRTTWSQLRPNPLQITTDEAPAETNAPPADPPGADPPPSSNAPPPEATAPTAPTPHDQPLGSSTNQHHPVILTPGPLGVTVVSEDRDALEQAVALLRAYGRGGGGGGGGGNNDFGVYPLQNASADRVARVLTGIYRGYGPRGPIHFAADERMNAVVVKASRGERREVEALLETLDTSQVPEYYRSNQPVVLALEHANAGQVFAQLKTLYRTELSRGERQPPIEIPPGAEPEVVATLQQINASREGPLLSLEVDADSNSLLMIAPRPLLEEIREFVAQVDEQSRESRVGVRVVPLESLQGEQMLRSLRQLLNSRR